MASATSFYDFKPLDKRSHPVPMSTYKNRIVLIVNSASKCGFTPQLNSLESMYTRLSTQFPSSFAILAFPCNQFGNQDPGSNDQIQEFCQLNYGVTFPVMAKIDVNGEHAEPLFEWMKKEKPGFMGLKRVKWNFEKFLVDADGRVVERWMSTTKPEECEARIVKELEKLEARKKEEEKL